MGTAVVAGTSFRVRPPIAASISNLGSMQIMKTRYVLGLLGVLLSAGCSQHYVLRLNSGQELIAATKPKSDGHGWYRFKDSDGREVKVNELRVREIEAQ